MKIWGFHRAAKGGTQKGICHFFLFWSPFGDDFVTFFDVLGHFFAYLLLPPPFCGRVRICFRFRFRNGKANIEEERRCNTRGGKASESLSEENCPLEALRVFLFSKNSHRKKKPPRRPLRGSGFFSGSALVVPLRRCTSSSLRKSIPPDFLGCGFFAYSWKLPAYSGAFLLTVDNFSFFCLQLELFCLQF